MVLKGQVVPGLCDQISQELLYETCLRVLRFHRVYLLLSILDSHLIVEEYHYFSQNEQLLFIPLDL